MPRNVEIKARIKDFNKVIGIAARICGTEAEIFSQEDIFFKTQSGRLKLRSFQDGSESQLIFYERPNSETPKISDYSIHFVEDPIELLSVLKPALGIIGVVKKKRYLFLYEQTRIHIDKVEGLGEFLELEVILTPYQSFEDGQKVVSFLMKELEIDNEDLIKEAYIDLLQKIKI